MKCLTSLRSLLAIALLATPLLSFAQSSAMPNLTGTWHATADIMHADGQIDQVDWTLTIKKQNGHFLQGTSDWSLANAHSKVSIAGKATQTGHEPFIGLIDKPHEVLYLVKTTEQSVIMARITGDNSMIVNYMEPGKHAVVARAIFARTNE